MSGPADVVLTGEIVPANPDAAATANGRVEPWAEQPPQIVAWINGWLIAHAGRSKATLESYRTVMGMWLEFCTARGVDPVCPSKTEVDAWHRGMAQVPTQRTGRPPRPGTLANRVAVLSSWFGYLLEEDVIAAVPVRRSTRPKFPKDTDTVGLSAAEAAMLQARLDVESVLDRAVMLTLLQQGLRISELLDMTVGDLRHNQGQQTMVVRRGKGGKRREIAVAAEAGQAIADLLAHRTVGGEPPDPGEVLFTTPAKRPTPRGLRRTVRRITRAAGILSWDRLSPHSLRHTCCTLALEDGSTLHEVQEFLGHASADTTSRYDRARGSISRSVRVARAVSHAMERGRDRAHPKESQTTTGAGQ